MTDQNKIVRSYFSDKRDYSFDLYKDSDDIDPEFWFERADNNKEAYEILDSDLAELFTFYNEDGFYDHSFDKLNILRKNRPTEDYRVRVLILLGLQYEPESQRELILMLAGEYYKMIYGFIRSIGNDDLLNMTLFALLNMEEEIGEKGMPMIDAFIASIPRIQNNVNKNERHLTTLRQQYDIINRQRKIKNIVQ